MKKLVILLAFSFTSALASVFFTAQYFESESLKAQISAETVQAEQVSEIHAAASDAVKMDLPEKLEKVAKQVLKEIPENQTQSLKKVVADYAPKARRGLASFKSVYLGVNSINSEAEFRRVFIHELGHVVDLGALRSTEKTTDSGFRDGSNIIYASDPSLDFYQLCWKSESTKNTNCSEKDFVSGYAQTDAFEDFAESYLLFVENNQAFIRLAKESVVLQKKYDFFVQIVFQNQFESTPDFASSQKNIWDMTKVF